MDITTDTATQTRERESPDDCDLRESPLPARRLHGSIVVLLESSVLAAVLALAATSEPAGAQVSPREVSIVSAG